MPKSNHTNSHVSVEQLEYAVKIAARVVSLYGETYLPIFNRLHAELMKAKENEVQKSLALQLALKYNEDK